MNEYTSGDALKPEPKLADIHAYWIALDLIAQLSGQTGIPKEKVAELLADELTKLLLPAQGGNECEQSLCLQSYC